VTQSFTRHAAVFTADVIGVEDDASSGLMRKKVTLRVLDSWKGVTTSDVILSTGIGRGDCGFDFTPGTRYLIYGGWDRDGELGTSICTRTKPLKDATSDLAELGPPNIVIQPEPTPATATPTIVLTPTPVPSDESRVSDEAAQDGHTTTAVVTGAVAAVVLIPAVLLFRRRRHPRR